VQQIQQHVSLHFLNTSLL